MLNYNFSINRCVKDFCNINKNKDLTYADVNDIIFKSQLFIENDENFPNWICFYHITENEFYNLSYKDLILKKENFYNKNLELAKHRVIDYNTILLEYYTIKLLYGENEGYQLYIKRNNYNKMVKNSNEIEKERKCIINQMLPQFSEFGFKNYIL